MARVNLCGFETGNGNESFTFVGTTAVQATTIRSGTYALQVNPTGTGTGFFRLGLLNADGTTAFASVTTSYLRFYFLFTILPASASEQICEVLAGGGTTKIEMRIDSSGKLSCYANTTQIGSTGTKVLVSSRWYCIEFKVGSGAANVAWEIRVDGTVEISGSDTLADPGTSGLWSLGKGINRNSNSVEFYYDDMAIDDAAYPGPGSIIRLDPAADVSKTNWLNEAASSTNEFASVDDYAAGAGDDGDTTYVVTSTAGTQTFTVSFTALTLPRILGINEIKLFVSARDTGTVNAYQIQLRPASNAQATTALDGGTSPYTQRAILYKAIGGTDVLSTINVNTCQASIIKTQSQARELRCTAMALMLDIPVINGPSVNVNQAVKRGAFF